MPVFDFIAVGRIVVRYALIIGLVMYVLSMVNMLGDAILSLWSVISSSVDSLGNNLNHSSSGGGKAMSCMYYLAHELGIDTALSSFFISAMGLLILWATLIIHTLMIRMTFVLKNLLVDGSK